MTMFTVTIYLTVLVVFAQGSDKKGVVHWADSYMCDDFKALDNMTWWFDFRMSLSYFHEKHICSSTIDNYKKTHVPMVWGYWSKTKINIADEAQYILGFNEPNHKKQSKMTPKKAAAAWRQVEKNSKGKPLVSPSAAVCGKKCLSDEITWFDKFFKLCKGCRVDYLATHTYWCNAEKVMKYLKMLSKRYKRKIWLTEFACSKTKNQWKQLNFMKRILPKLEAADYIYRYSWYSARVIKTSGFITRAASLLEPYRSALTPLGRYYNEFQGRMGKITTNKSKKVTSTQSKKITTTPPEKVTNKPAGVETTTHSGNVVTTYSGNVTVTTAYSMSAPTTHPENLANTYPGIVITSHHENGTTTCSVNVTATVPENASNIHQGNVTTTHPKNVVTAPPGNVTTAHPVNVTSTHSGDVATLHPGNVTTTPPMKVTTTPPMEVTTTTPKKVTTSTSSHMDASKETLLILQSYTSNPTAWWRIINFMKKNSNKLPKSVRVLYKTSTKKQIRQRIKKTFREILCAYINIIPNRELRKMVEKVRNLPDETKGKKKRKAWKLRVPKC